MPDKAVLKAGVAARATAAGLVGRVDREGAWSNALLRKLDMPENDARLVRHLTYGTLRNLARIDRAIAAMSKRPFGSIQGPLLDCLRVAFHEVLFDRTPDHAAADTAAEAARAAGYGPAVGFVNALVRRLQRQGEPSPPGSLSETYGIPQWATADLRETWGLESTAAFLEASHRQAPLTFWMEEGVRPPAGAVLTAVAGVYARGTVPAPPGALIIDPASAAAAQAVMVSPGHRVLDIGAAPGGKSAILWAAAPRALAAVDVHPRRIRRAARRWAGSEFGGWWVLADGRRPPFPPGTFDRVLLDAPCTGLGTLRRRPEIRYRVTEDDYRRLASRQRSLLEAGLEMLRPGGRLVYSVCTVTSAETTGAVAGLGARPPEGLPGRRTEEGLLMAPHLTDTDGMFIAVLQR